MIDRIVHLGFEVRVEMTLADDSPLIAQLTRAQVEELELAGRPDRLRHPEPRAGVHQRRVAADRGARARVSLAEVVAWVMLALLIGWLGADPRSRPCATLAARSAGPRSRASLRLAARLGRRGRDEARLAALRGLGVLREPENRLRKLVGDDRGQGHGLEHLADVGPQREPDLLQRLAPPRYSMSSAPSPRTVASGPSTARMISASVISSASRASQ